MFNQLHHQNVILYEQGKTNLCVCFRHFSPCRHPELRLDLQLLTNPYQLVLHFLARPKTFWKDTECLAAGKGEMICLTEGERSQGPFSGMPGLKARCQRRSSHYLAASILILQKLFGNDNKHSFSNVSYLD
jgi:hypothetical protein